MVATKQFEEESVNITQDPFPASQKIYIDGAIHSDIKVPMREISLDPNSNEQPVRIYDTSGVYTDPNVAIDIRKGLEPIRKKWIESRGDVERYEGREIKPEITAWIASLICQKQPKRSRM